tara:strand:- start:1497 stop:3314 length:1818 start_codon:yes stop_codon:yes gene_type:complete
MKTIKQREQDQIDYVADLVKNPKKNLLAATINQIISMRSSGYRSTAYVFGDLIDNSIEAGASKIVIDIDKSLNRILVIDDGMGMQPELISHAMTYGGTHRHGSEDMLGKFGMGAANATNSIAEETSFRSKKKGAEFHSSTFSFAKLKNGDYNSGNNIEVPAAKAWKLSGEAKDVIEANFKSFECGTIIEMRPEIERLSHKTQSGLANHLITTFGVMYCKFLSSNKIIVNGVTVKPTNPLFNDPNAHLFDVEGEKPEDIQPIQTVTIKNRVTGKQGEVRVSFTYLGKRFLSDSKNRSDEMQQRWAVMRDWHGFIMSRNGRVLNTITHIKKSDWDSVPKNLKKTFQNNDRYIKIGIDFDATLDEDFSVEFNKQDAMPDARIWNAILQQTDIWQRWTLAAKKYNADDLAQQEKASSEESKNEEGARPSEVALESASAYENPQTLEEAERVIDLGEKRLEQEAKKEARKSGDDDSDPEVIARHADAIVAANKGRKFTVSHKAQPDGAHFFSIDLVKDKKAKLPTTKVIINTNHRFYTDFYMNANWSNGFVRSALETMLGSIGDRWYLTDDNEDFYKREVGHWSTKLEEALKKLTDQISKSQSKPKAKSS